MYRTDWLIVAAATVWHAANVALAAQDLEVVADPELRRSKASRYFYESMWATPVAVPDAQTYPCNDFQQVEAAANDFRAVYGSPPLIYSTDLETEATLALSEDIETCTESGEAPAWPDAVNGTAFGLGFRVYGRPPSANSYKCVQAVNSWFQGKAPPPPKDNRPTNPPRTGSEVAWSVLMWRGLEEVGCAVRTCVGADDTVVSYVVYCLFSPWALDLLKDREQLRQQVPTQADRAEGCIPEVFQTERGGSLVDLFVNRFPDREMDESRLFCYHQQYTPEEISTFGVSLALPCPGEYVPSSCPELDLYYRGAEPGTCPTTYVMLPGDTFETVASKFDNITAEDLCCFNALYNNVYYNFCEDIPPLQGTLSTIVIPCAKDMEHRNCEGGRKDQEVMYCPDVNNTVESLNLIRATYGLNPLKWDPALADVMYEGAIDRGVIDSPLCINPFEPSFNDTKFPEVWDYVWWSQNLVNTVTSTTCTPAILLLQATLNQMADYLQRFEAPDVLASDNTIMANYAVTMASNNATSFGCAVQVCDSYHVNVYCIFDVLYDISMSGNLRDLKALPHLSECPRTEFPMEGSSYETIAAENNLTMQELLCFHGWSTDGSYSDVRWSIGAPVVIPCPADDPETVTCEAWDVYQAQTGDHCNFSATVLPGEDYYALTARFPNLGYDGCDLCCFSGDGDNATCDPALGERVFLPCADEVGPYTEEDCACKALPVIEPVAGTREVDGDGGGDSSSDLGMILGLAVGIPLALAVVLLSGALLLVNRRREAALARALEPQPMSMVLDAFKKGGKGEGSDGIGGVVLGESGGPKGLESIYMSSIMEADEDDDYYEDDSLTLPMHTGSGYPSHESVTPTARSASSPNDDSSLGQPGTALGAENVPGRRPSNTSTASALDSSGNGGGGGSSNLEVTAGVLPVQRQESGSWVVDPDHMMVCKRTDGTGEWVLGVGTFSKVYKGLYHGQDVAIKVLNHDKELQAVDARALLKEVKMLRRCQHGNVVRFMGAGFGKGDAIMLVFELMQGGDLFKQLRGEEGRQYSWPNRGREIALDVARGLAYIHSKRVVHCDLKSPNILLGEDGTAKIADLGMSKYVHGSQYVTKGADMGTFAWASPEQLFNERITNKSDIYSYGVILWEIVTGEMPQRGQLRDARSPEECPQEVGDLVSRCLETSPDKRPEAQEIVAVLERAVAEANSGIDSNGSGCEMA